MNDPTTPARAALREAISSRASARATHQAATDALARADDLITDLAGELERHASANATAEAQHTDEIAAAIKRGGKPAVSLSRAAREARHAQADITTRHTMAQGARARLATELADAAATAAASERAVLAAASAVIGADAVEKVAAFQKAQAAMFAAFDAIASLDSIGVNLPPHTPLAPWPAAVQRCLYDFSAIAPAIDMMRPPAILSNSPRARAAARWSYYLTALANDADATLADVADPTLPHSTPIHTHAPAAPITREQPWLPSENDLSRALVGPHAAIA